MVDVEQSIQEIYSVLDTVKDPEVPVLSLIELGVIRDVELIDDQVKIKITPTYSGCPAMLVMQADIKKALSDHGYNKIDIEQVLTPVWTTDWLTESSKNKLKEYGIAPPCLSHQLETEIECPQCNSVNTRLQSQFGATACKAMYVCEDCKEPFEYFKAI